MFSKFKLSLGLAFVLLMLVIGILPAWAQEENSHCVGRVYPAEMKRQGEHLQCFNNVRDAIAFATNGAVLVSQNATLQQVSVAIRAAEQQLATLSAQGNITKRLNHVVAIQWDWTNRGSSSYAFTSTSLCSATLDGHILSSDYGLFPSGWNNRIESFEAFAGCASVQAWDNTGLSGSNITCATYCSTMGAMNNATSSSRTHK